ncbi:hypothetical protein [Hymenobacter sp. UYP22]|uniref:hypothetical protein n=1 Tax=Hymenobacter sp. UYP22 TaxID=3156348 RepID=UPI003393CD52
MREAVATRFGQPLRYPSHCDALEAELQKTAATGGRRLSPSTLRRFFGLVSKEGGYHLHTLDTLARYAGHPDFAAFGRSVSALVTAPLTSSPPPDIPELLGMALLSYPERLLLGYFLGRVTRPVAPTGAAAPLALRLAAHPAGQELFVESFVDLAYLTGAYGEILTEYLRHKRTPEAQLFGHCTLFLGEFLAEDTAAWQTRLPLLLALPVPPKTHAFPRGRRAFAQIMAAWYEAPNQPLSNALLQQLQQEAASIPQPTLPSPALPDFYNLFPAGYHFLVAEALFLTQQFAALTDWIATTWAAFPTVAALQQNVYAELLRAFEAVAHLRTGQTTTRPEGLQALFTLDTHTWLLDYYQVYLWLTGLHFTTDSAEVSRLQISVQEFASRHRMPFFQQVAKNILTCSDGRRQ